MIKFLFIFFLFYLGYRVLRGFIKRIVFFSQFPNQTHSEEPFTFRQRSDLKEKDISDRARILDDDKNSE